MNRLNFSGSSRSLNFVPLDKFVQLHHQIQTEQSSIGKFNLFAVDDVVAEVAAIVGEAGALEAEEVGELGDL